LVTVHKSIDHAAVLDKVLMGFLKINLLEWYPGIIALSVRTVRKTGTVPSFIVLML